jgi:predicted GNAT family N-acyltransferase
MYHRPVHQAKEPVLSDLSLRIATSEEDVLKVLVVRGIVFIEEQQVDWEGEIDEFEKTATHFLGEVGGQPVATGRLRHLEDGWVKVERIAVRPRWRGQGYAKEIVAFMLDHAQAKGTGKFKMHAQVYLEDFYREFGFVREGGVFGECGIDHILMVREDDEGRDG